MNTLRICGLFFLSSFISKGQVTVFSENMGGGTGSFSIGGNAFQNSGCSFSYSGTGNVNTTNNSVSQYSFASGGKNVQLSANEDFIIEGLNLIEYNTVTLKYGVWKNTPVIGSDAAPDFKIEVNINNGGWNTVQRPTVQWPTGAWQAELITIMASTTATNVSFRFSNTGLILTQFCLDDFIVTGVPSSNLTQPTPYSGWPTSYIFSGWSSTSAIGSNPSNMVFHFADNNIVDPNLSQVNATKDYSLAYNLNCGTRIQGQNVNGISFANANPGHTSTNSGNLGEAVLALNTACRGSVTVQWLAGSTASTSNIYNLRAQYRVGTTGSFTDLPGGTAAIEYSSNNTSTAVAFGPILLPTVCDDTADVQIRWVYYHASGSGSPSEIFLDDIVITSQPYPVVSPFAKPTICGGDTMPPPTINPLPTTFTWSNSSPTLILTAASSGSTIPSLVAPMLPDSVDQIATITYTATLGSCSYSSSLSTIVRGRKEKTTWNGSISSNWFRHENWSNCMCHEGAEGKIVSSGSIATIAYPTAKAKKLEVANSASLVLSPGGVLELKEDLENNGYASLTGSVVLNGTVTQELRANNSSITFSSLILNNPAGAIIKDSVHILGSLHLHSGNFTTSNLLRLKSTNLSTARISSVSAGATISGNVTIERLAPGGATGWAQFGAPITSSNTFAQWDDDFVITCTNCPDGYYNFTSIYSYDEPAIGTYSDAIKYKALGNITDNTVIGKGYWVYFGNGNQLSTDMKFSVTGSVVTHSVSIPVTMSTPSNSADYGWNLISNPMPSALSWAAVKSTNTLVENAYYVYNADLNNNMGGYASYINSISSPSVNGLTDNVPMCQGFYVHALSSGNIVINESMKSSGNPVFMKQPSNAKPVFRLFQSSSKHKDECAFYFESGATKHFQGDYDAYKLNFDPDNIPYIGSLADSILTSINGLPPLITNHTVDVKAITPITGTFVFSGIKSDFPYDVCVTLIDTYNATTTDLLSNSYTCTLYDTTTTARFKISFFSHPLTGSGHVMQPDCPNPNGGFITAVANSNGPWNYEWSQNGSVIKTSLAVNVADTLYTPASGPYSVKINTDGTCDRFEQNFYVQKIEATFASFSSDKDTTYLSQGGTVNFKNNSINSINHIWDFGNGQTLNTNSDPSYSYFSAGLYHVRLFTESATSCKDTAEKNIVALDDVTTLLRNSGAQEIILMYDNGTQDYSLMFNFKEATEVDMQLFDQKGAILKNESWGSMRRDKKTVDLRTLNEGVYLLHLTVKGQTPFVFKLIR